MLRGVGVTLLALTATAQMAPVRAQSRFHAGIGAGAGFVSAVGSTRASYAAGPAGKAEILFGMAGSPWSARIEVSYLRLHTPHPELRFPLLNVLAFSAAAVRRLGAPGRPLTPYLMAGAGPHNLQDALPFAAWHTRLGVHAGAGAEFGRGRLRAFAEGRVTHVTGQPATDFLLLGAGIRWGL